MAQGKRIFSIQYTMKKTHIAMVSLFGLVLLVMGFMSDKNWLVVIGIILTIAPIVLFIAIVKALKKAIKRFEETKKFEEAKKLGESEK